MITLAYVITAAFALSFAATPVIRTLSRKFGVIDLPNERSSHRDPTPRSGGIAIILGTLVPIGVGGWLAVSPWGVCAIVVVFIALVGLIDDVRSVSAAVRFAAQCVAAVAAVFLGGFVVRFIDLPWGGVIPLSVVAVPLTILYIAGLTNAYNFMDGVNGIATLEAIVAGTTFAILFWQAGDVIGALLAGALASAAAGFLPWNFPKATIFMGDAGSGALGIIFGLLSIRYALENGSIVAPLLPLLPFLFDTSVTLARRVASRERLHVAHRSHFYQRLSRLGWSHAGVSLVWAGLAAAGGAIAIGYAAVSPLARTILVLALIATHVVTGSLIHNAERPATSIEA